MKTTITILYIGLCVAFVNGQGAPATSQQLSQSSLPEDKQRALFVNSGDGSPFKLAINTVAAPSLVDNAAVRQLKGDKVAFPFLDTLPNQGSAVFITTLKPCGIILPHVHPRATEQYLIVSGTMVTGLSEESTGRQNVTATVTPGQSFVAPQGLLHYNANRQCTPLVFLQIFNSDDPGTVSVLGGIVALGKVDTQTIGAIGAGNLTASPLGGFGLDSGCLSTCGLSSSGGGLGGLSQEMQALVGMSATPMSAPGVAPPVSG